jgi:hypothetical protein
MLSCSPRDSDGPVLKPLLLGEFLVVRINLRERARCTERRVLAALLVGEFIQLIERRFRSVDALVAGDARPQRRSARRARRADTAAITGVIMRCAPALAGAAEKLRVLRDVDRLAQRQAGVILLCEQRSERCAVRFGVIVDQTDKIVFAKPERALLSDHLFTDRNGVERLQLPHWVFHLLLPSSLFVFAAVASVKSAVVVIIGVGVRIVAAIFVVHRPVEITRHVVRIFHAIAEVVVMLARHLENVLELAQQR